MCFESLDLTSVCAGSRAQCPGLPIGSGVTAAAARELGLQVGTPVATSLIDADAGWLGSVLCLVDVDSAVGVASQAATSQRAQLEGSANKHSPVEATADLAAHRLIGSRAALVCGTSVSLFWHASRRVPVPGVWGPFPDALIGGFHQLAGGLNAAGRLVCGLLTLLVGTSSTESSHTRIL